MAGTGEGGGGVLLCDIFKSDISFLTEVTSLRQADRVFRKIISRLGFILDISNISLSNVFKYTMIF